MSEEASWISVGALAHAFSRDNYAPPATSELAGRRHGLHLEGGGVLNYRFLDDNLLICHASEDEDSLLGSDEPEEPTAPASWPGARPSSVGDASAVTPYFAARIREGIYFVDHTRADEPAATVTLVLDLGRGAATVVAGRLPGEADSRRPLADRIAAGEELTAVSAQFASAAIDTPLTRDTPRHSSTLDMVGGRVEYTYSSTEQYEHIYLNERFYTWHCLQGSERGLADTDRCHYHKVDDGLYLFVWREKIIPTLGVVVVDFESLRTTGKIFGYESAAERTPSEGDPSNAEFTQGKLSNFIVGARARVIDQPGKVGNGG